MRCPACPDAVLVMADRQGVEIDYCPNCRGVWLDRGELDKIIERSAGAGSGAPAGRDDRGRASSPQGRDHRRADRDDDDDRDEDDDRDRRHPQRRKRGFLSELFDFD